MNVVNDHGQSPDRRDVPADVIIGAGLFRCITVLRAVAVVWLCALSQEERRSMFYGDCVRDREIAREGRAE